MRILGIEALYPKPNLSRPSPGHEVYPYLLRGVSIERPNQVWSTDITYIPMQGGFLYLVAVMDWFSRFVLSWELSNTMEAGFCLAALEAAFRFGQPEIKLGVAPGMGGSQRLTRAVGKAKAMDMCLTGRMMDATEAERAGLVTRVVPLAELLADALKTAETIAAMPPLAAQMNKEMVNLAFETTLDQGLLAERRMFQVLTATEDKAEGMKAFVEKRPGVWKGR